MRPFIEREQAFAADASHELRTPLATIRGAAEVLADDPGLDAGQRARLARITRSCDEMGELIAALLLLSREEDSQAEPSCDVGQAIRQCAERYREPAAAPHPLSLGACGEAVHPDREVALGKALREFAASRVRKAFYHGPFDLAARVAPPRYLERARAAGVVVGKLGTATCTLDELRG